MGTRQFAWDGSSPPSNSGADKDCTSPLLKLLLTFRRSAAIHEATAPNLDLRVKHLSARSCSVVIMANDEILTDDYVAELLAKDAKESTIKYSSLGLEAFAQSK